MILILYILGPRLVQGADMLHEAAFKVSCLIGMPGIFLCEFVYHTDNLRQELFCLGLIGDLA